MEHQHTPGPWRWIAVSRGWNGVGSDHGDICKFSQNNPPNARLIAAAPDLLEACEKAADTFADFAKTLNRFRKPVLAEACIVAECATRAAIRKAIGEEE